jgi:CHAT domain-containing protein
VLCLLTFLAATPARAQELSGFDQAIEAADLGLARQRMEILPKGAARTLAAVEYALLTGRTSVAWSELAAVSPPALATPLRARFFNLRGELQLAVGQPALAKRDFEQALIEKAGIARKARASLGLVQAELALDLLEDARVTLRGLLAMPGQERAATLAAASIARAQGRWEDALIDYRNLATSSRLARQPWTLWLDQLEAARVLAGSVRADEAIRSAKALAEQALGKSPYRTLQAVELVLTASEVEKDKAQPWLRDLLSRMPPSWERGYLWTRLSDLQSSSDPVALRNALRDSSASDPSLQAYVHARIAQSLQFLQRQQAAREYATALRLLGSYQESWLGGPGWNLGRVEILQSRAEAERLNAEWDQAVRTLDQAAELALQARPVEQRRPILRLKLKWALEGLDLSRAEQAWDTLLQDLPSLSEGGQVEAMAMDLAVFNSHFDTWSNQQLGYNYLSPPDPIEELLARQTRGDLGFVSHYLRACQETLDEGQRQGQPLEVFSAHLARGRFLLFLGDLEQARASLESAVAVAEKSLGGEEQRQPQIQLARLEARSGAREQALARLLGALRDLPATQSRAQFYYLLAAQEALDQGRLEQAEQTLDRLLAAQPSYIAGQHMKARLLIAQKRWPEAFSLLDRLPLWRGVTHDKLRATLATGDLEAAQVLLDDFLLLGQEPDVPLFHSALLVDQGDLDLARGEMEMALISYRRALAECLEFRARRDPRLVGLFFERSPAARQVLQRNLAILLRLGRTEKAKELMIRYGFAELAKDPELVSLAASPAALASWTSKGSIPASAAEQRAEVLLKLADLRAQEPALDSLLALRAHELEQAQQQLSGGTVLVHAVPLPHLLVLLVLKHDSLALRSIPMESKRLANLVDRLHGDLSTPTSDLSMLRQRAREVGRLVLDPLASELEGSDHLVVLPSGVLWGLPWEILIDRRGDYLVQSIQVSYLDAWRPQREPPRALTGARILLGEGVGENGEVLAGARTELRDLRDLLQATILPTSPSDPAFARELRTASLVHLATHGLLEGQQSHQAALLVNGSLLTSEQILDLHLAPASLVVLSACNGARENGRSGRDTSSLVGAFLLSGASTAIGAQWSVDDAASLEFFARFYRDLLDGATPGAALLSTKRAWLVSPNHAHPFYWAPFVLYGQTG